MIKVKNEMKPCSRPHQKPRVFSGRQVFRSIVSAQLVMIKMIATNRMMFVLLKRFDFDDFMGFEFIND
jgi:hypothetical protein